MSCCDNEIGGKIRLLSVRDVRVRFLIDREKSRRARPPYIFYTVPYTYVRESSGVEMMMDDVNSS